MKKMNKYCTNSGIYIANLHFACYNGLTFRLKKYCGGCHEVL